jgi:hypothetical protein
MCTDGDHGCDQETMLCVELGFIKPFTYECICKEGFVFKPEVTDQRCITTNSPTPIPTFSPTSSSPTTAPTLHPSMAPSAEPTTTPTQIPTMDPTLVPTIHSCFLNKCDTESTTCIPVDTESRENYLKTLSTDQMDDLKDKVISYSDKHGFEGVGQSDDSSYSELYGSFGNGSEESDEYYCMCLPGFVPNNADPRTCKTASPTKIPTPEPTPEPTIEAVPTPRVTAFMLQPTDAPTHMPTHTPCPEGTYHDCDTTSTMCVLSDMDVNLGSYEATGYEAYICVCLEGFVENPTDAMSCLASQAPTIRPTSFPTNLPTSQPICSHCYSQSQNMDESDVDCGGSCCLGCAGGGTCGVNADCLSGVCLNGRCGPGSPTAAPIAGVVPLSCSNQVRDNSETSIDCGGEECNPCQPGQPCDIGDDCTSGFCIDGFCSTKAPSLSPTASPNGGTYLCEVGCIGASCGADGDCWPGYHCDPILLKCSEECPGGYFCQCSDNSECTSGHCHPEFARCFNPEAEPQPITDFVRSIPPTYAPTTTAHPCASDNHKCDSTTTTCMVPAMPAGNQVVAYVCVCLPGFSKEPSQMFECVVETEVPTGTPTGTPTLTPTSAPSAEPTKFITPKPSPLPTGLPTTSPSHMPSGEPSSTPTPAPSFGPTKLNTPSPTPDPTGIPTTGTPTAQPTFAPTLAPTHHPTPEHCSDGNHGCQTDTTICVPYDVDPELAQLQSEGVISDAMYHVAQARIISYQCICLEEFQPDPTNEFRCLPKFGYRQLRENRALAAAVGSLREWGVVGVGKSSEQSDLVGVLAVGGVGAVLALAGIAMAVGAIRKRSADSTEAAPAARETNRVYNDEDAEFSSEIIASEMQQATI